MLKVILKYLNWLLISILLRADKKKSDLLLNITWAFGSCAPLPLFITYLICCIKD